MWLKGGRYEECVPEWSGPTSWYKDGKTNSVKYNDKYGSREADMKNACLDGLAQRHVKMMETVLSIMTNTAQGRQI
jgi:hypothetical protein